MNDSFGILKTIRPCCAGKAQSSMSVYSSREWVSEDKEASVGTGSLQDVGCPTLISPLGKPELHKFRICLHLLETSKCH